MKQQEGFLRLQRAVGGDGAVAQGARGRGLQRLLGGGKRLLEQAGYRSQALVRGLQGLRRLADLIEQRVQAVGAVVEGLRGEVGGRVIERRVHLLAGGEVILRGRQQRCGVLQRQQVLPHAGGEGNSRHLGVPFW